MTGFGTRQVADILGFTQARVRSYVRAGFLAPERGPRGEFRFSFPDLVLLRTARSLLASNVPARRVRRALARLRRELPGKRRLTDLRIAAEGGRVVVTDGPTRWQPESGQTLFDFGVAELAARVAPLARETLAKARAEEGFSAEDWYELACELEPGTPAEALEAYRRALSLDPGHGGAHVNLGRLLHERGDPAGAERHYREALRARPEDATAAFNLGVALEDLGRDRAALAAYERALSLEAENADAHFNAASLCERMGEAKAALRHWTSYRKLTSGRR